MSSIEKRNRDGKVTYLARWRDDSGRQKKKTFVRKVDAQRFVIQLDSSLLSGTYTDPSEGRVLLDEWAKTWLGSRAHLKPSTRTRYESLLRKHVLPRFGRTPLSRITHADVTTWCSQMTSDGYAPGTVRQAHRVLSLMLTLALRDGRLAKNPCVGVPLPRARRNSHGYLSVHELHALADAAGDQRLAILVLGYTGLRFGELVALRVRNVDLMRRRLTISEAATEVKGHLVWGTTKTHQTRTVALPRFLADELATHLANRRPDDLAFTATRGGPLRLNVWRKVHFRPACQAAGLANLTDLRVHDLRHTAASLAISAGANVKVVQQMLGHASAAMTLDVYAGLFQTDMDLVAERLDALVPRTCPEPVVVDLAERRNAL